MERTTLGLADGLLKTCSTVAFVEYLERTLPELFNCERATCVLVHRKKKYLFRIIPDEANGAIRLKKWELGTGFSGIVAVSARTLHTQKLEKDDINFVKEVDDPNFDWNLRPRDWPAGQHPACQIVTVPVFTHENRANLGKQDQEFDQPHCIVHLINKKPTIFDTEEGKKYSDDELENLRQAASFSQADIEQMETLSFSIGRCAEHIYKIEQLFAMKNLTSDLIDVAAEVETDMGENAMNTNIMIEHFKMFSEQAYNRRGEAVELQGIFKDMIED